MIQEHEGFWWFSYPLADPNTLFDLLFHYRVLCSVSILGAQVQEYFLAKIKNKKMMWGVYKLTLAQMWMCYYKKKSHFCPSRIVAQLFPTSHQIQVLKFEVSKVSIL